MNHCLVDIDSKKFPLKTNVQKLQEKTAIKEHILSDGWKIKAFRNTWSSRLKRKNS
ncbi:hypothetical protein HYE34_00985 [Mycoplasmopsis bovis]|nr:hypothetical protein HYE34_00985 [Mycoplasmopsis bovis]